eukprot:2436885-Rhodomonas_salina.2
MEKSNDKIIIFDGPHTAWPTASNKLVADAMTEDIQWVLWSADNNPEELLKIAATLKPTDTVIQLKNQAKFYGRLLIPPTTLNPGTAQALWNVLLDQYQNSANIAKVLTLINLANFCLSFKGGKWSAYFGGAESLINLFKSTTADGKLTVDDMVMAMMLQGMILAGGLWSTLAMMMLTDEKLTLESLRARTYSHSVNFGLENGSTIEVNNTDNKSDSTASSVSGSSTDLNLDTLL